MTIKNKYKLLGGKIMFNSEKEIIGFLLTLTRTKEDLTEEIEKEIINFISVSNDRNFHIGDKVRIKSWNKMCEEFDHDEDIYCNATFVSGMKYLCGKEIIIEDIRKYDVENYDVIQNIDGYVISFDMIEKCL
jgi:hypothetical protein